jgi:hypothetical protein
MKWPGFGEDASLKILNPNLAAAQIVIRLDLANFEAWLISALAMLVINFC